MFPGRTRGKLVVGHSPTLCFTELANAHNRQAQQVAIAGKQLSRLLYYTPVVRLLQKAPYGGRMRVLLALGWVSPNPTLMKKWGSHVLGLGLPQPQLPVF